MPLNRRVFLASAAMAAAPSDTVRLGAIGTGGRGRLVMTTFQKDPTVRITALCDVYEPNLERAISMAKGATSYREYRKLLADREVDAVLIATPEHWHHRMVLDALQAGKDIYVEKPLCHTPEEGVDLVEAERQSNRVVQVGMQRRSYDLYHEGRKIVAAGTLGSVRMVRSWWLNNYLGSRPAGNLEGKLDWEAWQGPVPHRPFDPDRFHHWRNYRDYAGGILADQGAHVFDGIHMLMGAGAPAVVTAAAGKPHRQGFDTPESVVATAEYPEDFIASFSINYGAMRYPSRLDQSNHLDGDQARMDIGREELAVYKQGDERPAVTARSARGFGYATDLHVQNFLACVRSRQRPTAPMALAFQAALVAQLANLSLKLGRRIRWNRAARKVEY